VLKCQRKEQRTPLDADIGPKQAKATHTHATQSFWIMGIHTEPRLGFFLFLDLLVQLLKLVSSYAAWEKFFQCLVGSLLMMFSTHFTYIRQITHITHIRHITHYTRHSHHTSTHPHITHNTSTNQHINTSTHQHINTSTHQHTST